MAKSSKHELKKLSKMEGVDRKPRKPGQITGVGNPGTTTYTGKPGINRGQKGSK